MDSDYFIQKFHQIIKLKINLVDYEYAPYTKHVEAFQSIVQEICKEMMEDTFKSKESTIT